MFEMYNNEMTIMIVLFIKNAMIICFVKKSLMLTKAAFF